MSESLGVHIRSRSVSHVLDSLLPTFGMGVGYISLQLFSTAEVGSRL